jgi:hypothetical protein
VLVNPTYRVDCNPNVRTLQRRRSCSESNVWACTVAPSFFPLIMCMPSVARTASIPDPGPHRPTAISSLFLLYFLLLRRVIFHIRVDLKFWTYANSMAFRPWAPRPGYRQQCHRSSSHQSTSTSISRSRGRCTSLGDDRVGAETVQCKFWFIVCNENYISYFPFPDVSNFRKNKPL